MSCQCSSFPSPLSPSSALTHPQRNHKRALIDLEAAARLNHTDPVTWNQIGLAYDHMGQCGLAVEAHLKATALKPDFKESWANMVRGPFREAYQLTLLT